MSSVRQVDLATGRVLLSRALPPELFGEGLALHRGVLYQLTWRSGTVLAYDPETLSLRGRFHIDGEGWGLASDGQRLVMSDGSVTLFLQPQDFRETGRVRYIARRGRG